LVGMSERPRYAGKWKTHFAVFRMWYLAGIHNRFILAFTLASGSVPFKHWCVWRLTVTIVINLMFSTVIVIVIKWYAIIHFGEWLTIVCTWLFFYTRGAQIQGIWSPRPLYFLLWHMVFPSSFWQVFPLYIQKYVSGHVHQAESVR
jgi:hypothetical protein